MLRCFLTISPSGRRDVGSHENEVATVTFSDVKLQPLYRGSLGNRSYRVCGTALGSSEQIMRRHKPAGMTSQVLCFGPSLECIPWFSACE